MRPIIRISILMIVLNILLPSCIKNSTSKPEPTYVLKDQLIAIEDGLPNVGYSLILITYTGSMGENKKEIGNTIADDNGNFVFNVSTKYHLSLGFRDDITRQFRPLGGDTVDIGIIKAYRQ